jgi:4,4'-diaponeurosporenoate glycosyltransferase
MDADLTVEPRGVSALMDTYSRLGGLVTVQPYHRTHRSHESLSAVFNVMIVAGVGAFSALGERLKPAGGFGPCMVCSHRDYDRVGGHEPVKGTVLENLALGVVFQDHGIPVHCLGGKGTVSFRMYPNGVGEMVEGWSKAVATGASHSHPLLLAASIVWISGAFSAAGAAAGLLLPNLGAGWPAVAAAYSLYALEMMWMLRRIGRFHPFAWIAFPASYAFFVAVFARSIYFVFVKKEVRWKGRTVPVGTDEGRV